MKKKAANTKRPGVGRRVGVARRKPDGLAPLIAEVRGLIQAARHAAASTVNTLQVLTNFEIGRRIVKHEQKGEKRAAYGTELLMELSARLTDEFGKGFSRSNLQNMRTFFLLWEDRDPKICQKASGKLAIKQRRQKPSGKLQISQEPIAKSISKSDDERPGHNSPIQQQPTVKLAASEIFEKPSRELAVIDIEHMPGGKLAIWQKLTAKSDSPFILGWSHYVELLSIKNPDERSFYEIEAASSGWSVPELKRQKASCLFERLALSREKAGVKRLAEKGQIITRPEDMLKQPLMLEFLGLDEQSAYSETDLESALITHLEKFLLELGKGFLFEARQKRFTFGGDHYFCDLIFYNRLLRSYVVIDLKLDKLTHQDLGQMQMYVNYYDRHVKLAEENRTIGLLLCKENNEAIVELTLPKDFNIHAREYLLYLPSKELLKAKLLEWSREEERRA